MARPCIFAGMSHHKVKATMISAFNLGTDSAIIKYCIGRLSGKRFCNDMTFRCVPRSYFNTSR